MLPPGNSSGETTNVSVETASSSRPTFTTAASPSCASTSFLNRGRNRSRSSVALNLPPEPCPSWTRAVAGAGAGHTRAAAARVSRLISHLRARRPAEPAEVVVRGARALGRHHWCAERHLGRALRAERRALDRLQPPAQHLAGVAQRRLARLDALEAEPALGVELGEL